MRPINSVRPSPQRHNNAATTSTTLTSVDRSPIAQWFFAWIFLVGLFVRIVAKILDHYMTVRWAANFLLLLSLHLRTWSSCHSWYLSVRILYSVWQCELAVKFKLNFHFCVNFPHFLFRKRQVEFAFCVSLTSLRVFFCAFCSVHFRFHSLTLRYLCSVSGYFYSFCFFHLFTLVPSSLFKFNAFLHLSCSRFSSPFAALGSPSALLCLSSPSHVAICCYLGVVEFAVKNSRQLSGAWVWWGSNCARCHR